MYAIYYVNHYGDGSARANTARTDRTRLAGPRAAAEELLYSPRIPSRLLHAAKLQREVNKAGRLEFKLPADNPAVLAKLTSECVVMRDGAEIWRGRVLQDEGGLERPRKVLCEGLLNYLRDGIIPPYSYSGSAAGLLADLLSTYNAGQTDAWKQFDLGDVADFAGETYETENKDFRGALDEVNALVQKLGGYLNAYRDRETGRNVLDWTRKSGRHCLQQIRFGDNLLDFKDKISAEKVFTVLIPLGKRETGDIENSYGGDGQTVPENTNADRVYNYMKSAMRLTTAAACGALANILAESDADPAYTDGGKYGICGWSGTRLVSLQSRADYQTLSGQLAFMAAELEDLFYDVLRYIRGVDNSGRGAYDAAYYWSYDYQLPEDRAAESRRRANMAINDLWPTYSTGGSGGEVITPDLGDRVTIESVNDGKNYLINEAAAEVYGRIWKTETFDDVEDPAVLLAKGRAALQDGGMLRKMELTALDLKTLGVDTDALDVGVYCDLLVEPLGLRRVGEDAPNCTKTDIDLLNIQNQKYTFGSSYDALAAQQAAIGIAGRDLRDGANGVIAMAAAARSYMRTAGTLAQTALGGAVDAAAAASSAQVIFDTLPEAIETATTYLLHYTLDSSRQLTGAGTVAEVITAARNGKRIIGVNEADDSVCTFIVQYTAAGENYNIILETTDAKWSGNNLAAGDTLVLQIEI